MFLMLSLALADDAAFLAGDLEGAVSGWAERIDAGEVDGDLYYNLGNAHFARGEVPKAVLSWRRAQLLSPRDGDIEANLDKGRRLTQDRIEAPRSRHLLSPRELGLLASALVLLAGLLALARHPRFALTAGLPGLALALASAWRVASFGAGAVVLADSVEVRSAGGGGVALFELHGGAEVLLEQQVGEMSQIALPDGRRGWMPSRALGVIDPRLDAPR